MVSAARSLPTPSSCPPRRRCFGCWFVLLFRDVPGEGKEHVVEGRPSKRDVVDLDLGALTARTLRDGILLATGCSDALLGHPLDALAWLASRRSQLGLGLSAGTFVSLGTITPVVWVDGPGEFRIEVEGLGSVTVMVS